MGKELAIIIPTYCEKENISRVVGLLEPLLVGIDWEVVFVDDDSPDGTLDILLQLARSNPRVRFLRRIGRRGLSSACIEGMCATSAEYLAVMDADLQHDESILPRMVAALRGEPELDLAVATRYAAGGSVGKWSATRHWLSRSATFLEKLLLPTSMSDPMSGFFVLRREVFESAVRGLTGGGFKVLLDLVLSSPKVLKIREFEYTFRPRQFGESKLDVVVGMEFLYLLADKLVGRILPVRFVFYVLVGLTGLGLHLVLLGVFHQVFGWSFTASQWFATLAAMVSNFLINNQITFRANRLRGSAVVPGVLFYIGICFVGAVANVQVAEFLFRGDIPWWLAGTVGAVIGAVWNYAVSTQIVWTWLQRRIAKQEAARIAGERE